MGGGVDRLEAAGLPVPNPSESYARHLLNLSVVLAALGCICLGITTRQSPQAVDAIASQTPPASKSTAPQPEPQKPVAPEPPKPAPAPRPEPPVPPAPPPLDSAAVAAAESELDAASRDRARAEARADEERQALEDATAKSAAASQAASKLALRVRDPSARVSVASARGGLLKAEKDKLKAEAAALGRVPKPKPKVLSNQTPVAKAAEGEEYHFELRGKRIAYINLDRLLDLVKSDAQLRIRLGDGARTIDAQVGPVGAFSLQYGLARSLPTGLDDMMQRRGIAVSYNLRSWEVIPEFEGRGETYETIRQPISDFARVINAANPRRSTITLWVYPDAFELYRQVRDDLHARGYLVAARPLPQGMAIRGSPAGSLSAGQ